MIDTAAAVGSVAVFKGQQCVVFLTTSGSNAHAEEIPVMIVDCLKQADISINQLAAIGVNKGPGSYTGLRIGTSLAKGLCYALNVPLLAVDSMKVMARMAKTQWPEANRFVCMVDARRDEVFTSSFDADLNAVVPLHAEILLADSFAESQVNVAICGNCSEKFNRIVEGSEKFRFFDGLPGAQDCGLDLELLFNAAEFADVAYFEPDYGKAFIAGATQKFKL